jgi:hypothetical protein
MFVVPIQDRENEPADADGQSEYVEQREQFVLSEPVNEDAKPVVCHNGKYWTAATGG